MARKPMSLKPYRDNYAQASHDRYCMLDTSFDDPSDDIIEAMNTFLVNRSAQELTPRERALRSMGA